MLEKDKEKTTKQKAVPKNAKGVTLTAEEKEQLLPSLRMESRMKYLDQKEKEKLDFAEKRLQDDELLFSNQELTLKEIKLR